VKRDAVPAELRRLVIERAANWPVPARPRGDFSCGSRDSLCLRGETILDNLARACVSCSLRKAAREKGFDPETGDEVRLFNPRRDDWSAHFRWDGIYLVGLSSIGRATIHSLKMNRPLVLAIREEEVALGRHAGANPSV